MRRSLSVGEAVDRGAGPLVSVRARRRERELTWPAIRARTTAASEERHDDRLQQRRQKRADHAHCPLVATTCQRPVVRRAARSHCPPRDAHRFFRMAAGSLTEVRCAAAVPPVPVPGTELSEKGGQLARIVRPLTASMAGLRGDRDTETRKGVAVASPRCLVLSFVVRTAFMLDAEKESKLS